MTSRPRLRTEDFYPLLEQVLGFIAMQKTYDGLIKDYFAEVKASRIKNGSLNFSVRLSQWQAAIAADGKWLWVFIAVEGETPVAIYVLTHSEFRKLFKADKADALDAFARLASELGSCHNLQDGNHSVKISNLPAPVWEA